MADARYFEELTIPMLDALYRLARTLTGDEHEARDLVQSTYTKALQRFESYRTGTNCRAWMMRIMRNTWIDELRHRKVAGPSVPLEEQWLESPADRPTHEAEADFGNLLERFSDAEVISALGELPEQQRMALFLFDVEGLDQQEIAEVLDVAVGTVKSRVSRARSVLRDKLEEYAREMGFFGRR
jgi:RNA polymerase sigma-70 factor (ECF subfamily)